jgi:drug/metabolite transporter (DMT)-like permease
LSEDESIVEKETKIAMEFSRNQVVAVGEAIFVTILWASSWVIIKFGLENENLPPLTFSGLRYTFASVILLGVIAVNSEYRIAVKSMNRRWWSVLIVYGVVFVTITQGSQFVGLFFLDAIMVSALLNLTPIIVLFMGAVYLKELPTRYQTIWIILGVVGAMIYFYPLDFVSQSLFGIIVVLIGVIANAFSSIIGRYVNKEHVAPPLVITGISMAIGAFLLLGSGLLIERLEAVTPLAWIYILWLAIVNTAFAFTLWNKAMQTLRAVDMTIINSTMLPQIVILSIIFLDENPTPLDWVGLILLALSVAFVQISQARRANSNSNKIKSQSVEDKL